MPLPAREAYRLWADQYESETAVSALEDRLVSERSLGGARALLDAGCGTGRRLAAVKGRVALATGVDLVPEMPRAGRRLDPERSGLVVSDLRALPYADGTFDLLWCRLVLGHLRELEGAYRELRRVAVDGAELVVTDFHPAASAAGHSRTFRDAEGHVHQVEHHVHARERHAAAARGTGWSLEASIDGVPGLQERPYYDRAGRGEQFERERALPLVLMMCFRA